LRSEDSSSNSWKVFCQRCKRRNSQCWTWLSTNNQRRTSIFFRAHHWQEKKGVHLADDVDMRHINNCWSYCNTSDNIWGLFLALYPMARIG
jgi:hypothetical protein